MDVISDLAMDYILQLGKLLRLNIDNHAGIYLFIF